MQGQLIETRFTPQDEEYARAVKRQLRKEARFMRETPFISLPELDDMLESVAGRADRANKLAYIERYR